MPLAVCRSSLAGFLETKNWRGSGSVFGKVPELKVGQSFKQRCRNRNFVLYLLRKEQPYERCNIASVKGIKSICLPMTGLPIPSERSDIVTLQTRLFSHQCVCNRLTPMVEFPVILPRGALCSSWFCAGHRSGRPRTLARPGAEALAHRSRCWRGAQKPRWSANHAGRRVGA